MNILIIEDDQLFREKLATDLRSIGYTVVEKRQLNISDVEKITNVDLAIIDMHLPGTNGLELIKAFSKLGVKTIMLTSDNGMELEHQVLVAGASDFVIKPYYLATLHLKINRLIKNSNTIVAGDNILDLTAMVLNGNVKLTDSEFRVLSLLMSKQGIIVPKNELLDLLWENNHFVEINSLNVLISRLRTKIKHENIMIATVVGKGYIIE